MKCVQDKTKGYWETFIGKCFDFRLNNFASKPTKANIGELQLMNHLHFGSGAGQDRLTQCVLFFTVNTTKSYKGDTMVCIGQNQAGKKCSKFEEYAKHWSVHCPHGPDWVDKFYSNQKVVTRNQGSRRNEKNENARRLNTCVVLRDMS